MSSMIHSTPKMKKHRNVSYSDFSVLLYKCSLELPPSHRWCWRGTWSGRSVLWKSLYVILRNKLREQAGAIASTLSSQFIYSWRLTKVMAVIGTSSILWVRCSSQCLSPFVSIKLWSSLLRNMTYWSFNQGYTFPSTMLNTFIDTLMKNLTSTSITKYTGSNSLCGLW